VLPRAALGSSRRGSVAYWRQSRTSGAGGRGRWFWRRSAAPSDCGLLGWRPRQRCGAALAVARTALRAGRAVEPATGVVVGAEIADGRFVTSLALAEFVLVCAAVRTPEYNAAHG
jgi:hypothetical protein